MNDDSLVDLVIPIYNLRKHRYNNFCFLVDCLSMIDLESYGCNLIVCEQESNTTQNTEHFLTKYTNVKHLVIEGGDVFNKSVAINHAFHKSSSEFFWMSDGDVYFEFEQVINNIDISSDFIRPFEYVVSLSVDDSEYFMQHRRHKNLKREQTVNNCTGKYSFIVRRSTFESVGLMNEDFEGWGFQDLDFSENRMKDYKPLVISGPGYHLYHETASRKYADRNRRLYMNLGGELDYGETNVIIEQEEDTTPKETFEIEPPTETELVVPKAKEISIAEPKIVKWDSLTKQIVYHRVSKNNVFNL